MDWETYYDKEAGYDLKSMSITEYVRDNRFWPHGLGYRFLDDERSHWLAGTHAVEAWIASVDWANTVVVAHNVRFDGAILAWRFGVKPFAWMDTVGLAKAVIGENISGYSLRQLANYMGLPPKGEISCEGVLRPSEEQLAQLGEYCKNDVDICHAIYAKLMPQFPQSQLWSMDWTIRCFVEPKLALDIAVLEKGVADETKRRTETIARSGLTKEQLSSNKQFAEHLKRIGVSVLTKRSGRTGAEIPAFAKTDKGLEALRYSHPALYEARLAAKSSLLETRGQSLIAVGKTGAFPFDVGFSGASQTHRYSGGSAAGGNPQNFTRNSFLRGAIRAPEGYGLVVGDFAAIELRLLAWLAQEPRLMGKIINDEDVYTDFASTKYGRRITKADKAERQYGKESILGLSYGMGKAKFRDRIKTVLGKDITEDEAWQTVQLYRTTYSRVPRLWENAQSLLPLISSGKVGCTWFAPFIKVRPNALVLPSGLTIKYPNLRYGLYFDKKADKMKEGWHYDVYYTVSKPEPTGLYGGKIVENLCQALAGELCRESIERAASVGLHPVGQVHDEILCVDADPDFAKEKLKECMEASPTWMPTLKLKAEVAYGDNWNAAKA